MRIWVLLMILIAASQPAFSQNSNIPLSTPGLDSACKVYPDKPLSEASTGGDQNEIRCEWLSPVRVEGRSIKGGAAGIDTSNQRDWYNIMKAAQDEFAEAFADKSNAIVLDKSGIIDCSESRIVVWSVDGISLHSHSTAWCGGVGINFATSGADFTEEGAAIFAQIVRNIMSERAGK